MRDMKQLRAKYYYDKDVPRNPEEKKGEETICDARTQNVCIVHVGWEVWKYVKENSQKEIKECKIKLIK